MSNPPVHIPVLHSAPGEGDSPVLSLLVPKPGERVLDVTLGLGGHSEALLDAVSPGGTLTALDADLENMAFARKRLERFGDRVTLIHANFRDVASLGIEPVDVLLADLGLSSPHVDNPERGFTFRTDAPLDLRFDQTAGAPAFTMLRELESIDITAILRDFGEIERPRKLAETLSEAFRGGATRTGDVKKVVEDLYGFRAPSLLPQVFQALRIAVNDEMGALRNLLDAIPGLLRPGGRAAIMSYHSLEDRMVKDRFRELTTTEKNEVTGADIRPADFVLLTRKPIVADEKELARNPRARSAKMRAIQKSA